MYNTISIKTQSKRATTWQEKKAINVNLFYRNFQIGIVSSGNWGNYDEERPNIEIQIDGEDYSIPLDKFKNIIKSKSHYKVN